MPTVSLHEFIPFNLCDPTIHNFLETSETLRPILLRHDFVETTPTAQQLEILPDHVGIWTHGDVELFINSLGIAVIRVCIGTESLVGGEKWLAQDANVIAKLLNERLDVHGKVSKSIFLEEEYPKIFLCLKEIQAKLEKPGTLKSARLSPLRTLYGLSAFHFSEEGHSEIDPKLIAACLAPQDVGASDSEYTAKLENCETITNSIIDLVPQLQYFESAQDRMSAAFYASWSSVVICANESISKSYTKMVNAIQFRVQSTWFAAHTMTELLRDTPLTTQPMRNKQFRRQILWVQYSLDRLAILSRTRVGASSPFFTEKCLEAVRSTSELEVEIQLATESLLTVTRHADLVDSEQLRTSRTVLEVLALLFATSSFAQLTMPLPLTFENIANNPFPAIANGILLVLGLLAILRNY